MKRTLIVLLATVFISTSLYAGETKKKVSFWDSLKTKITKIVPKKKSNLNAPTVVGGVRGAKEESADKLYWKNKEVEMNVAQDELDEFNSALTLAVDGNVEEAKKGFETFLATYPDSHLCGDAQTAIKQLQAVEVKTVKPEEKEKPAE